MLLPRDLVVWNNKLRLEDKDVVGQEIAGLGELAHNDVAILHRIVITPYAFSTFLDENNLPQQIKHLLGSINHDRHDSILQVSRYIKSIITHATISSAIFEPIFNFMEKLESKSVTLSAFYFKDGKLVGSGLWNGLSGESVLVEHMRIAYAQLFSPEYLGKHTIHHNNHDTFSACLYVAPEIPFSLTGTVATVGKEKGEFEIEAHSMVKFCYNKHSNELTHGQVFEGGNKLALTPSDIKQLLTYAHASEKAFYLPQVLYWGKYGNDFLVTKILPPSEVTSYDDTYHSLIQNVTVHPGVTIGRLRVIDDKSKTAIISNDEIIMVKKLDKSMLDAVKKAKGLIIEEDPHPEIVHILKNFGIPTIVKKNDRFLYSTGDVISLNATTGEIKRGSMLVS